MILIHSSLFYTGSPGGHDRPISPLHSDNSGKELWRYVRSLYVPAPICHFVLMIFLPNILPCGLQSYKNDFISSIQDIEGINLYDYKYNYVNLTGFRLVDPNDEYTRDIIKEMYYYERDTELKLLYDKDYNTIPVRNNVFLI